MELECLFVGNEIDGNFALDFCERKGYHITYAGNHSHVSNVVNLILDKDYKIVIVNIEMFIDDANEIAETLSRVQKVNNAKFILFAPGFNTESSIIIAFVKNGFNNYIFSINRGGQIDQLEKCLNGFYDVNGIEELQPVLEEIEKAQKPKNITYKTIGIAGTLSRIGTTTQAIQIVKYLILNGYKACYLQMNSHPFIDALTNLYLDCKTNPDLGLTQYMNVDLYKTDHINEVLKMDYDYYVKDYGVYASGDFENLSFLEQDINIIVAGAKPEEMYHIDALINSNYYNDVFYIFSFIADSDRKDLLDMMEEKKKDTYFVHYTPDPFTYSTASDEVYSSILGIAPATESTQTKHRFPFLKWKKGKTHAEETV